MITSCPQPGPGNAEPDETIDYDFAQQELMENELCNDPIQEAIGAIEKQHEEDKQGLIFISFILFFFMIVSMTRLN